MSDRAELLIGGWIAGTLTPAERRELLDAAMANQTLFDALADEEGLRELLADPAVRRDLSALLGQHPASAPARASSWWDWMRHPGSLAAAGVAAVVLVGLLALRPGLDDRAKEATQPTAAKTVPAPAAASDKAPPQPGGVVVEAEKKAVRAFEPRRDIASPPKVTAAAPGPVDSADKPASQAFGGVAVANAGNEARPAEPRLEVAAAPRPALPAPPPAAVGSPGAILPAAPVPAPGEVKKAKEEAAALVDSVAVGAVASDLAQVAPISYRVERQTPEGGAWTPVPGGTVLRTGDRARLAITSAHPGTVRIRAGSEELTLRVTPGEVIHYPPAGVLAAERGERSIAISFLPPTPPALPETQSAAPPAAARSRQAQQAVGGSGQYTIAVRVTYR